MDSNALVLGIVGILATLVASGLGLFYTARARAAPLREMLYAKQVEVILDAFRTIGRIREHAGLLYQTTADDQRVEHWTKLQAELVAFGELSARAAALLPTEVYAALNGFSGVASDFLLKVADGRKSPETPEAIAGHAAKFALLARTFMGVDELSKESARLFVKAKHLDGVIATSPESIVEMVKRKSEGEVVRKSRP